VSSAYVIKSAPNSEVPAAATKAGVPPKASAPTAMPAMNTKMSFIVLIPPQVCVESLLPVTTPGLPRADKIGMGGRVKSE